MYVILSINSPFLFFSDQTTLFKPFVKNGITFKHSKQDIVEPTARDSSRMKRMCVRMPARLVLYFLSWSGFLVSFMMRNDINLALVAMVKSQNHTMDLNGNETTTANVNQFCCDDTLRKRFSV